jgi:hypothetical protein
MDTLQDAFFFCTSDCKFFSMPVFAFSSTVVFNSYNKVEKPFCAAANAIPLPMVPAPQTQILLITMYNHYKCKYIVCKPGIKLAIMHLR